MTDGSVEEIEEMGLTKVTLRVLVFVAPDLTKTHFRPVKQQYVAHGLGMLQQSVSRSMQVLTNRGVLERGEADGTSETYRLAKSHPVLDLLYNKTA